jgi:hypothetical protein
MAKQAYRDVPKPQKAIKGVREPHKPKSERQKAITELDRLWGLKVRARDNHICQYCGQPGNNPHHIVSRSSKNTRWDLENGITLCGGHHKFVAHQRPERFREFLIQRMGQAKYDALQLRGNMAARGLDLKLIGLSLK